MRLARVWRLGAQPAGCALALAACLGTFATAQSTVEHVDTGSSGRTFADAQRLFYNAKYAEAAELALAIRVPGKEDLANDELRTSALLFQLKDRLEGRFDKDGALGRCQTCPDLIAAFMADLHRGQAFAHMTLLATPNDESALFFLGKLDLNYVWLQLGPLHRKTGWDEYWEARKSLDAVLALDPQHVRARVARAWIDYIVATRMPWGTHWLLGGGDRKQALAAVREAAQLDAEFFTHTEAEFALWDMQVRERDAAGAIVVARRLAEHFPDNRELAAFLDARKSSSR